MKKNKSGNQPSLAAYCTFWRAKIEERYLKIMKPVARFLAASGLDPNMMTILGCLSSALAGIVYAHGAFFWAAWVVLLAGLCDTLDGLTARLTHRQSAYRGFLNSLMGQYGELFILLGMAYFFVSGKKIFSLAWNIGIKTDPWPVILIILVLGGSLLGQYLRVRTETLGLECKPGLIQRPEHIILLITASLLTVIPQVGFFLFKFVLGILAVLTQVTALQRAIDIHKKLSARSR